MKRGDDVFISQFIEFRYPDLVDIGNHVGIDFGFYCSTQLKIASPSNPCTRLFGNPRTRPSTDRWFAARAD